jgi:hypothetical protein
MKQLNPLVYVVLFVTSLFTHTLLNAQLKLPTGSQKASVSQTVGTTEMYINYSRPSVNGREIWGALVPYGMNNLGFGTATASPWRAGANENTIIKFTSDVKVEGKPLAAGKYGLHIVVKEDGGATIIFSKNYTAWGSFFYEPSEDALRVEVQTKTIPHVEQLTYTFVDVTANSATAVLNWEKKQFPFKIEVDVTNVVLADIRKKLQEDLSLWLDDNYEVNRERYNSKLYVEDETSSALVKGVPPIFSETSEEVAGRMILRENFDYIFANNPKVVTFGEDAGHIGGVNQSLEGLQEKYGEIRRKRIY